MPRFAFIAQDGELKQTEGEFEAPDYDKAIETLQAKGLYVLSLQEAVPRRWQHSLGLSLSSQASGQDLIRFARGLAMLLEGGLPILRALKPLARQTQNPTMRKALEELIPAVASGKDLSQALSAHAVFPSLLCQLVKAGESAGTLVQILRQYTDYLQRQEDLKRKVKGALMYPAIVILFGLGLTDFMAVKVIPTFAGIFKEFHLKLPSLTVAIMIFSEFARNHQFYLLLGAVVLVWAARIYFRTDIGKLTWAHLKRRLPVFNIMFEDLGMEQLFATLAMMLESGVAALNSLNLVKDIFKDDPIAEKAINDVIQQVNGGKGLAESFRSTGFLAEVSVDAMEIGEEAGSLPRTLEHLAKFHGERLDDYSKNLSTLLEPLMLIFVGGLVGLIMLSLFLPMSQLVNLKPM